MLKYDKLIARLKAAGYTPSSLRKYSFSPSLIYRLQRGEYVNTINIDKLCALLHCQPGDLMEYVEDDSIADQEQKDGD